MRGSGSEKGIYERDHEVGEFFEENFLTTTVYAVDDVRPRSYNFFPWMLSLGIISLINFLFFR